MLVLCLIPLICFAPIKSVTDKNKELNNIQITEHVELIEYLTLRLDGDLNSNFPIHSPIKVRDIYRVSDLYGWRFRHPVTKKSVYHHGIDFSAYTGTNVFSTASGIVTEADWVNGYGKQITINHGNGYETRYAHLSKINVSINDSVRLNAIIGLSGNTGISTGPHLHYEVLKDGRPMDPMKMLIDNPSKKHLAFYLNLLARTDKIAWL